MPLDQSPSRQPRLQPTNGCQIPGSLDSLPLWQPSWGASGKSQFIALKCVVLDLCAAFGRQDIGLKLRLNMLPSGLASGLLPAISARRWCSAMRLLGDFEMARSLTETTPQHARSKAAFVPAVLAGIAVAMLFGGGTATACPSGPRPIGAYDT